MDDVYQPDRVKEAIQVFGADDPAHPAVAYLRNKVKDYYVGGKVQAIQPPTHFDYVALRCTSRLRCLPKALAYTPYQTPPQSSELTSRRSPGVKLSLSRPATLCTARTES